MPDDDPQGGGFFNLGGVVCPKCGQRLPLFRVPTSLHQLMWGGWTCPDCGCEMDKWGKAVDSGDASTGTPG
jgi:hypothetical protein